MGPAASKTGDHAGTMVTASFAGLATHWRGEAASRAADHVTGVLGIGGRLAEDTAAVGRSATGS